ncbi:GatB/YqeY domain-containing protein [Endozoicomonas sp. 8E]|uniref:GatB/YqeY domain-containing protein n=1 Tax=Endozoicomonas sp. 8E TaxID=3035692 RepID=UPI002938D787|nr:GatB/YqeY domain-containing protein [Endozoicomonas sp. 8E]WOG29001.1 GatB/YqeY domain-containing protein [Endozoicomonas sp. 8E]
MSECQVKEQLTAAMKDAMRNRDKVRLGTIRLALAELKRIEVDEKSIDDTRALAALDKMAKQRRDAINQFESAGRTDLADQEKLELTILQGFLPSQLSTEEINQLVSKAIRESEARSMHDMGKVMGIIKPKVQGRADMSQVSQTIRQLLN